MLPQARPGTYKYFRRHVRQYKGDHVLIWLPYDKNKLHMTYQGPYGIKLKSVLTNNNYLYMKL